MAYINVLFLCLGLVLGTIQASELQVNINHVWKPDLGWEVTCSWELPSNETLQSVELYNSFEKVLTYKPENDGNRRNDVLTRPEDTLTVACASKDQGQTGTCVLTMELLQPQQDNIQIGCSVKGVYEEIYKVTVIYVSAPPANATVETGLLDKQSGKVKLNCTSGGLLRPNLRWTIGDQEIPEETGGGAWNSTSKLWNVWSLLYYTPSKEHSAVCTPEIRIENLVVKGQIAGSAPWWIINSMKAATVGYDTVPLRGGCG